MYDNVKIKSTTMGLNLLYLENDEKTQLVTSKLLHELFNEVIVVESAKKALELYKNSIEQKKHLLLLLDLDSSYDKVITLCQEIKKIDEDQVMIITSTLNNYTSELLNLGIYKSIVKPIKTLEQIATILGDASKKVLKLQEFKTQKFLLEQKNELIDKNIYLTSSNLSGNIIDISNAYLKFTGYSREEVLGHNHRIFRHHDLDKKIIKNLWETISSNKIWSGELKNHKKSGEEYWIQTTICPLYDANNTKIGYTAVKTDITNQKRLQELSIKDPLTQLFNRRHFDAHLKAEYKRAIWKKEYFALLLIGIDFFEQYKDEFGYVAADKVLLQISSQLQKCIDSKIYNIFRVTETEFAIIISNKDNGYIEEFSQNLLNSIENLKIKNTTSTISDFFTVSIGAINLNTKQYHTNNDDLYNIADENLTKAKKNGRNTLVMDINETYIQNLQNIDVITKLPNREALIHDLFLLEGEAMLILLHINQIKSLKDLYGFVFASNIIAKKAKELENILRSDESTLYNLNLQEFAILVTDKTLFEKYLLLLEHSILANDELEESINNKHHATNFTAGVAYGVKNIFNNADLILQEAIISKVKYKIYAKNQSMKQLQQNTLDRLNIYKKALHSGNIIPFFQPIVDANTEAIMKYEALARIETDDGEIISPYYFLDSAKEDQTFEYFTRQMMQKVFHVYAQSDVHISLNITYENIISESMIKYIQNRLDKYGGKGLTFEIVESEDIQDYKVLENFILMVKEYGCEVSIDDFGSGYSNFTNILRLNIDYIKIDGSLIKKLNTDKNVQHMIKGILVYAKNSGIKTIAEFVSSQELADIVKELGVDYIQGYYFGEPRSAKEYDLVEFDYE